MELIKKIVSVMGNTSGKVKCLYLPAQSGKTRKVEEEIKKYNLLNDYFGESNDINLIISANVRLLVCQTASRLQSDLTNEEIIDGPVFTWISGSEECNLSSKELAFDISVGNIEMVIMCAHPKRIKHLYNMIMELSKVRNFNKNVNIWIDEADASISKWSKYEHIITNPLITNITFISATFESVFKKYKRLQVIGFPETHPECYRCLQDANCVKVDFAGSAVEYINFILNKYPNLTSPGMCAFIPGDYKKESHNQVRKLLFEYGFCVLLINGDEKTLSTREQDIDLSDFFSINNGIPEEFNTVVARLYQTHELYRYPFAITGMECIKRGVTFQCDQVENDHSGFIFDYGIIPNIQQKVEAYQEMARLFGNVGNFQIFKQVQIYSTSTNFKKVQKQESMAMNIAKMVYERQLEDVGKEELTEAMNIEEDSKWELTQVEFTNRSDANNFLQSRGFNKNHKENKVGGFYLSSVTIALSILYYPDVIKQLASFKKTSTFDVNKNPLQTKFSRMIFCYKDLNDPLSIVFIVRIIKKL